MFCQFLLYSKMNHLYIYTHTHTRLFSHIIFQHVPSQVTRYSSTLAIQQDLIAYALEMKQFLSTNPKLLVHPSPSSPHWQLQVCSLSVVLLLFCRQVHFCLSFFAFRLFVCLFVCLFCFAFQACACGIWKFPG